MASIFWLLSIGCVAFLGFLAAPHAAEGILDVEAPLDRPTEQYDSVSFMRGPHVAEFYSRYRGGAWAHRAAFHVAQAKALDLLQLTPALEQSRADGRFDAEMTRLTLESPPNTEPKMETYGPYVSQFAWQLYRAIDWTQTHHGTTYDILAAERIPWNRKRDWTDRSVRHYLERLDLPRSPAPLDVTLRRAGVMMKPYFGYFRRHYPRTTTFFFVVHWWYPAVYESMMLGGNGPLQKARVEKADRLLAGAFKDRPQRMLLSREMMPSYSRLSPESANIFDNLHMLYEISYDILAYPKWTRQEKVAELNRVIQAMTYQPGDERLARKFILARPDMDPGKYEAWMKSCDGEISRIMTEMLDEIMPLMLSNYAAKRVEKAHRILQRKLCAGLGAGEPDSSLFDELKAVFPEMAMMPGAMEPAQSSQQMIQAMLNGWFEKHGKSPDLEPIPMEVEPK